MGQNKPVLIIGTGHSGSTLLDLVLGSHTDAFSLGEIQSLNWPRYRARVKSISGRVCGICEGNCPFWDSQESGEFLRRYFPSRGGRNWILRKRQSSPKFYTQLFELTESRVIVDSSKGISWARERLRAIAKAESLKPFVIYLHRDGRAIVNSLRRKKPNACIDDLARDWLNQVKVFEDFFESLHDVPKLAVSYESIAGSTENAIRRICDFVDIGFQDSMLTFWEHEHHLIGGNLGTRSPMFKKQRMITKGGASSPKWEHQREYLHSIHGNHYVTKSSPSIRLDERWRTELSEDNLSAFDAIAGPANVRYASKP